MSEQEKKSGGNVKEGSPLVVVEQSTASRHKTYRPTEDQPELHPKRSRAPAVPSVAEELKDVAAKNVDPKERRESELAITTEKLKHSVAKKLSSSTKKRDHSPEAITLAPIEVDIQKERVGVTPSQPVSPAVAVPSATQHLKSTVLEKKEPSKPDEEDSITDEVADLRTPGTAKKSSEWSDEEEAGGLPRSESRASRVSRAVRQLFCCGMPYEAPSEDNIASPRAEGI